MSYMFNGRTALTTVNLRNASFSLVTNSTSMFNNKSMTIYVKDTTAKNFINPGLGMPLLNPVIN